MIRHLLFTLLIFRALSAEDISSVSNVKAMQRARTPVVDIYYDVMDPEHYKVYVTLEGSSDNGASWTVDIRSAEGDTGLVRVGRGKHVIWYADKDYPKQYSASFRIKVKARNRMCPQRGDEGMAFVQGGKYRAQETEAEVSEYCIDKWEFPNVRGDFPDVYVTYAQAVDSCNSVGKKLCTELQWEYACAGKSRTPFPYGWSYFKERCNTDGDTAQVIGVGRYCASDFGVYDLSGNVYEWVADAYVDMPAAKGGALPPAHVDALQKRVIRGGNYALGESYSRCDARQWEWPKNATRQLGFRCCYTFPTE